MNRAEAVELMRELIEHQFVQQSEIAMRRDEVDRYSLILKSKNSLFLSAFAADKNLVLHEEKEKGLCKIYSP